MNSKSLALLSVLLFSVGIGEAARIFFLIPLTTRSEKQIYIPLIDALAKRGHELVVSTIIKSNYEAQENITEFVPMTLDEYFGESGLDPIENRQNTGRYYSLDIMEEENIKFKTRGCERVYENPDFQKAIKQKYDLVISNHFFGHCFDGILYRIGAPYIYLSSMIPYTVPYEMTGAALPASFVPFAMGPPRVPGKLSFLDRLENVLLDIHVTLEFKYRVVPYHDQICRKYLGQDVPSGREIHKNVSMVFSNSHFTLNVPVPVLPDLIEVGGMHCRPAKPLPKDLDDFLSGAKDGFIFFSMGSILKSQFFPEKYRKIFVSVFSKLKQRVLWKFETDDFEDLPPNVKIGKWLPQQDILGHPNAKLFITHGGALSTQEAIYHGVPLISFPIFVDQNLNAITVEQKGFGIALEILELTEEKLSAAINKVLTDPSYHKKAKETSKHFRDQPIAPVDRAVFWTEYVIRHGGTTHLQSSARHLNFIEYYMLDVIALLVTVFSLLLTLLVLALRSVYRLLCKPSANTGGSKKKRQ